MSKTEYAEEKFEDSQQDNKKIIKKGISWTLDSDLAIDGLSSNDRIVKIMARNNSRLLGKWLDAIALKSGKIDIARIILKEFHECGATHRQKPDDMVKGITTLFKRYHSFKEKLDEQTEGEENLKYDGNGHIQFVNVPSSLEELVIKQCPYFLDLAKAFIVLYEHRPELKQDTEETELVDEAQTDTQIVSSDDEDQSVTSDVSDKKRTKKRPSACKHCGSKMEKEKFRLKKLKTESQVRRMDAETRRFELETHERVLALHAKYSEPRFEGSEEAKAANLLFKNTFPSLFPQDQGESFQQSESEIDELDE